MALLVLSTPLVACALPGLEMSKAEQDCCLQMSDQCGDSQMSDAHTCCSTTQVDSSTLQATSKYTPAMPGIVAQSAVSMTPVAANLLPRPQMLAYDSPSPPGSISILRI
jgi:hypothetical protein